MNFRVTGQVRWMSTTRNSPVLSRLHKTVIPNPFAQFANGVRDLLFLLNSVPRPRFSLDPQRMGAKTIKLWRLKKMVWRCVGIWGIKKGNIFIPLASPRRARGFKRAIEGRNFKNCTREQAKPWRNVCVSNEQR
jgi:hypothetical protein